VLYLFIDCFSRFLENKKSQPRCFEKKKSKSQRRYWETTVLAKKGEKVPISSTTKKNKRWTLFGATNIWYFHLLPHAKPRPL
jgi:hypothetical protein